MGSIPTSGSIPVDDSIFLHDSFLSIEIIVWPGGKKKEGKVYPLEHINYASPPVIMSCHRNCPCSIGSIRNKRRRHGSIGLSRNLLTLASDSTTAKSSCTCVSDHTRRGLLCPALAAAGRNSWCGRSTSRKRSDARRSSQNLAGVAFNGMTRSDSKRSMTSVAGPTGHGGRRLESRGLHCFVPRGLGGRSSTWRLQWPLIEGKECTLQMTSDHGTQRHEEPRGSPGTGARLTDVCQGNQSLDVSFLNCPRGDSKSLVLVGGRS